MQDLDADTGRGRLHQVSICGVCKMHRGGKELTVHWLQRLRKFRYESLFTKKINIKVYGIKKDTLVLYK